MSNYPDGMNQLDHDNEFDRPEPTAAERAEIVTQVIESLDNDDVIEMISEASKDFDIDFGDAVRGLFLQAGKPSPEDFMRIGVLIYEELGEQIREQAESNV